MDVEKIFRQSPLLREISMDTILFESNYPILFTCTQGQNAYLFSCCLVNASAIKWIGTETDYQLLIELLENRITIREVLLHAKEEKLFVQYDGKQVWVEFLDKEQIPHELLPTTGEYMNVEDDEFLEEITYFKKKVS